MSTHIYTPRGWPIDKRLAFYTEPEPNTGCWLWTGSIDSHGYGHLNLTGHRLRRAHRLAWESKHGHIQRGLSVLHRCDERSCVNPDHLWLGTHADNMRDMIAKGRARQVGHKGSENPQSRLTNAAVAEIRMRVAAGEKQVRVADSLGVSHQLVSKIVLRRLWSHI
jgi:hypothetical protein